MKREKFNVSGMTCSSCVSHVEKAVKKLAGVKKVEVSLLSNSMVVEYNEAILKVDDIIRSVEKAGYNASVPNLKKFTKEDANSHNILEMKKKVILSFCFLIPLIFISMHHMIFEWLHIPAPKVITDIFHGTSNAITFSFSQFLLLIPIIYINRNYFFNGIKRLFRFSPNMDSLIAMGSGVATIYGIFAIFMIGIGLGRGDDFFVEKYMSDIYFESAATILTLITFGKYLEAKSKGKTSDAIKKLVNLVPKTATVIRNGSEMKIYAKDIIIGDILVIKSGDIIPVDGDVIEGGAYIDQSSITGESIPVYKQRLDNVISGTINKTGYFKMRATKIGDDTTIAQIIKLVEEASNSRAPISKLADRVSGIFVPIVIAIALISFVVWLILGESFVNSIGFLVAVLVISCPCALGLATPVAIMVGTGKAAENGILIKSAESLELLGKIDTVIFDKTGTITEGNLKVDKIFSKIDEKEFLKIAASLEKKSEHPLSYAVLKSAENFDILLYDVKDFEVIPGRGIKGKINNTYYYGGNINFMVDNRINIEDIKTDDIGSTIIYFASEKELIGYIIVVDSVKEDSKSTIEKLKEKNIEVYMITGDNEYCAKSVAKNVGIENVIFDVLPQEKEKAVASLQDDGKKVAFVGDGINDSPALTKADVGIAIGSGTDIAIESADVVLVKNTPFDVLNTIFLSKAVIKNIKINLFWAFFYNIVSIPIAAGLFYLSYGIKLNPMIGALAMSFSSLCVVTNALRLRNFKVKYREEKKVMGNNKKIIYIEGMQCDHCKMSVNKVLLTLDVENVDVNLEEKKATITSKNIVENEKIIKVIEEAGFKVKEIKE